MNLSPAILAATVEGLQIENSRLRDALQALVKRTQNPRPQFDSKQGQADIAQAQVALEMADFCTGPPAVFDSLIAQNEQLVAALAAAALERGALRDALKRTLPWLGKLIADGTHLKCVAPNDALGALRQSEAAMSGKYQP